MTALAPLADYAWTQGPNFWLLIASVLLAIEAITGRAWWIWGAAGAGVAALLTLWLQMNPFVETAAFIAASVVGLVYSLRMRLDAAKRKARQMKAQAAA